MPRRTLAIVALAALATIAAAPTASPAAPGGQPAAPPTTLRLPAGFQPEGVAIGRTPYAYFGSRTDGDIYRADLRTGEGKVVFKGPGTPALGLKMDSRGRLFVAGGSGGDARVLDTFGGKAIKSYQLQTGTAFINDVTLSGSAAWFTDSANPFLSALPFGRGGTLPDEATKVPLTGDLVYAAGNNANGITPTPDGRALIIVQSNTGKIFHTTYAGVTKEIDLGGQAVPNGDGLWLRGTVLFVAENRTNEIAKIQLNDKGTTGKVISRTKNPAFDIPTTIAEWNNHLYLPNARFTTTATATTRYTATAVPIP